MVPNPMMHRRSGHLGWAIAIVLALTAACGPIEYVNQVTRKAATAVESAEAAQADKYSPYWYTLAVEYLHKSREEAAGSDFQAANRFGRKAEEAAIKAREEALRRAADPEAADFGPLPDDDPGMAPLVEEGADERLDDETPDLLRSEP
jgi:hypothetical protein